MPACLFPKRRFLFDSFVVNLIVVRKLDGNFCRDKLSTPFGQPNLTKTAAPEFAN